MPGSTVAHKNKTRRVFKRLTIKARARKTPPIQPQRRIGLHFNKVRQGVKYLHYGRDRQGRNYNQTRGENSEAPIDRTDAISTSITSISHEFSTFKGCDASRLPLLVVIFDLV